MKLSLFGPLRQYGEVTLQVEGSITVRDARELLRKQLPPQAAVVAQSAFADDERVLRDEDLLQGDAHYSVLPPVAGG
jgi:molybdopterin synthase sulfur carrier subunit